MTRPKPRTAVLPNTSGINMSESGNDVIWMVPDMLCRFANRRAASFSNICLQNENGTSHPQRRRQFRKASVSARNCGILSPISLAISIAVFRSGSEVTSTGAKNKSDATEKPILTVAGKYLLFPASIW